MHDIHTWLYSYIKKNHLYSEHIVKHRIGLQIVWNYFEMYSINTFVEFQQHVQVVYFSCSDSNTTARLNQDRSP